MSVMDRLASNFALDRGPYPCVRGSKTMKIMLLMLLIKSSKFSSVYYIIHFSFHALTLPKLQ